MVLEKKSSARVEAGQRRVLDEATRQRRLTRQLEALEKDNFQDDPLTSLPPPGPTARLPAFSETEEPEKKRRKTRGDHFKQRFRKNFTTLLEEEVSEVDALKTLRTGLDQMDALDRTAGHVGLLLLVGDAAPWFSGSGRSRTWTTQLVLTRLCLHCRTRTTRTLRFHRRSPELVPVGGNQNQNRPGSPGCFHFILF
ncbi:uncharacterized protein LOC129376605 isoform X1 [Poeciliopsis prolifica]|uniref:uncharacterized protein LOC129376605 isoform X1 n=1 Tax=Poeciliopsis prolifica TaxID=188132 RepID=UPI0024140426|nr:uncharacterized protein LOC129376605 isoform X1 [Poeciliopsis prolifica]